VRATHVWVGLLAAAAVAAVDARPAAAWGSRGHQIVGVMAYQELAGTPSQAKVHELLKSHPHYAEYLSADKPDGVALDDWVAMRAATWSDWVRSKPAFHRPTWHYVNKPFLLAPTSTLRAAVEKKFSSTKENHGDLLVAFPDCRRLVRDTTAPEADRAVRLCWVFHLAGDIHQPLHAVALCTPELPGGDLGGNRVWVRRRPTLNPTTLHSLWDNLPTAEGSDPVEVARTIRMTEEFTAAERQTGDVGAWAEESFDHAAASAYRYLGQPIQFALDADGGDPPSDVPVIAPDFTGYETAARAVARKRMLLAGLRLAEALKADLP
jgi:hypothetical protein